MQRFAQVARVGFAWAMIALGVIALAIHNFAAVWGPLPEWAPWQPALAVIYAAVALAAGIGLLFRRTQAVSALIVLVYVALWWLLLKVPPVFRAPLTELTWLDCGMYGILVAGAWTLYADVGGRPALGDERGVKLARLVFGLSLIPTGLSHFVYLQFTVPLIPHAFAYPVAWAYLTGVCHLAAGLGVLFGVLPRLAAQLESLMLGMFTVIVWIPKVIAAPGTRGNWTELWVSWALTAAAAVVAAGFPPRRPRAS